MPRIPSGTVVRPLAAAVPLAVCGAFLLLPGAAHAQATRPAIFPAGVSIGARASVSAPMGDLADGLGEGVFPATGAGGFGDAAELIMGFTPRVAGWIGWSRASFSCEDDADCGDDIEYTSRGGEGGLEMSLRDHRPAGAAAGASLIPWVRAGVVFHRVQIDDDTSEIESETGLGITLGGGLEFLLGESIAVVPAVRWYRYGADFEEGAVGELFSDLDGSNVSWFEGSVGVRLRLFAGG